MARHSKVPQHVIEQAKADAAFQARRDEIERKARIEIQNGAARGTVGQDYTGYDQ